MAGWCAATARVGAGTVGNHGFTGHDHSAKERVHVGKLHSRFIVIFIELLRICIPSDVGDAVGLQVGNAFNFEKAFFDRSTAIASKERFSDKAIFTFGQF